MKSFKSRNFNIDALFKALILLGYSIYFGYMLLSGRWALYVHPRNNPYILVFVVAMFFVAYMLIKEFNKPYINKLSSLPLLIFVLPLVLTAFFPPIELTSSLLSTAEVRVGSELLSQRERELLDEFDYRNDVSSISSKVALVDGKAILGDNNFSQWIDELYINRSRYIGVEVELVGFVMFQDNIGDNSFIAARMLMICCASDTLPIGMVVKYQSSVNLVRDQWVRVVGRIELGNYDGQEVPVVNAISVEAVERPTALYVYP